MAIIVYISLFLCAASLKKGREMLLALTCNVELVFPGHFPLLSSAYAHTNMRAHTRRLFITILLPSIVMVNWGLG